MGEAVQRRHRAQRVLDREELHKAVALGLLGGRVADDAHGPDGPVAPEGLVEVAARPGQGCFKSSRPPRPPDSPPSLGLTGRMRNRAASKVGSVSGRRGPRYLGLRVPRVWARENFTVCVAQVSRAWNAE